MIKRPPNKLIKMDQNKQFLVPNNDSVKELLYWTL